MAQALAQGLREHGMAVDVCGRGYEGEDLAATEPYDLVILDLMLPDRDGLDLCRNLRRRHIHTPLLILTALSDTQDKVRGLDAGADDYLTKPFEFEELLARLRALGRRPQTPAHAPSRYNDLTLDPTRREAIRQGKRIRLSNKEWALLAYFLAHPEQIVSKAQIIASVWDMNYEPTSNVVEVYVSSLRKKLDRHFQPPLIHTEIGVGYRFGQSAQEPDDAAAT